MTSFLFPVTIRDLLANSKSLLLFVLLIFFTSSVGRLWVCSCLGWFPWGSLTGSIWSFLWSSIRVPVFLVGVCTILLLVCRDWRWIYWTRIHVFYHGLAFSNLIFLVLFLVNRCIFPLSDFLQVLLMLLSYCSSIQLFCYVLLVAIF